MSELSGVIKDRYYILEEIGRGGLTTVYKALDVQEKREVAVKILALHLVQDPAFNVRFRREISILEEFEHPNIVSIFDSGEHEDIPFLVMPFFSKGTLTDRLRAAPLSAEECSRLMNDISSALSYEHQRGIIHRDIKPSNILMDEEGKAYLSDFDLVYLPDISQNLTGSAVIGTPAYMSPEQCNGGKVDTQSDQYSLAVVLFQLTTGHLPFYAESPIALAVQQINEPLPRPRDLNPNLPQHVEAVLLKALSKDPNQRYPSIVAFNQAFQRALKIAAIADQDDGSWTARYYEITQVLSRVRTKAQSWFAQPIFARRYSLIGMLILILIFSAILYSAFERAKSTSDAWLRATIAAVYTASVPGGGTLQDPSRVETVVAGTLHAMDIESISIVDLGTPIPVTGGESTPTDGIFGGTDPAPSGTPADGILPSWSPSPTSSSGIGSPTTSVPTTQSNPPPTLSQSPTWTPNATDGNTPTSTATATLSQTPTFTQTGTFTPSATIVPSDTPMATLPPPTKDVCVDIRLTSFGIQAVNANYTLTNSSSASVTISRIGLNWPISNQNLKQITVGGSTVWDVGDDEPPTQVNGIGSNLNSGSSVLLSFQFKRAAGSTGYSLNVNLTNGCVVSRGD